MAPVDYMYDLVVLGGGSGGMAAAKEAAHLGAKVAMFDFVKPSTQGTKWGLGGTCVNVGCVPKKLMHYAGLLGAGFHDARMMGWNIEEPTHNWEDLVNTVQSHVRSLNWGYKQGLRSAKVEYINALASFTGPHEITYTLKGERKTITASKFIVSVGGRPNVPIDIPGVLEHAITSDDLFSFSTVPGRTLCVGASYISLECAGFLREIGFDVTVAIRSIPLRGFDRQCAEKIVQQMDEMGITFLRQFIPTRLDRADPSGPIRVTLKNATTGEEKVEEYDTVLYATGRAADTTGLGLDAAGSITMTPSGKIVTDDNDCSSVSHVYAIGDCAAERPELTPVAIQAGELLARRLFNKATELMDYKLVATAVFTPFEYGCIGYSEEQAEAKYGKENIETYLFEFTSLELGACHRQKDKSRWASEYDDSPSPTSLSKLVCLKTEKEKVIGFHYIGANAGEITQGYALALMLGATKSHFDKVVGIHPTDVESFHSLSITRASGESWVAAGGCGGGKCG